MKNLMKFIFDIEADDLLDKATKIHCIAIKDIETLAVYRFYDEEVLPIRGERDYLLSSIALFFNKAELVVGHNIIGFDFPILKKFLNIEYSGEFVDTLVWSKVLNPDRQLPKGCPTIIPNPVTGRNDKIGPHGLHSWGYRVGVTKPSIFDWRDFTPELLNRCSEDIEINYLTYLALLKEAGLGS